MANYGDFNSQMQDEDEALALAIARSMEDQTNNNDVVSNLVWGGLGLSELRAQRL